MNIELEVLRSGKIVYIKNSSLKTKSVLLVLAGVSLAMINGGQQTIEKAGKSAEQTEVAGAIETLNEYYNGDKGTFSGSGTTYTLVVTNSHGASQTVSISDNVCIDKAGNGNIGKSKTITLDNEAPTISVNSNTTYAKSQTATVTISDAVTGLAGGSYRINYTWTNSSGTPSSYSSYTTITATAGEKTKTFEVTNNTSTGIMYLHVQGVKLKDVAGNTANRTVSGRFYLDNTGPTINVTPTSSWTDHIEVSVSSSDSHSGVANNPSYTFYANGVSYGSNTITSYRFTGLTAGKSYKIKVVGTDIAGNEGTGEVTWNTTAITGTVNFSNVSWDKGHATVTATGTQSGFVIQWKYQTESSWPDKTDSSRIISDGGKISGLIGGRTINARLFDGANQFGTNIGSLTLTAPELVIFDLTASSHVGFTQWNSDAGGVITRNGNWWTLENQASKEVWVRMHSTSPVGIASYQHLNITWHCEHNQSKGEMYPLIGTQQIGRIDMAYRRYRLRLRDF